MQKPSILFIKYDIILHPLTAIQRKHLFHCNAKNYQLSRISTIIILFILSQKSECFNTMLRCCCRSSQKNNPSILLFLRNVSKNARYSNFWFIVFSGCPFADHFCFVFLAFPKPNEVFSCFFLLSRPEDAKTPRLLRKTHKRRGVRNLLYHRMILNRSSGSSTFPEKPISSSQRST